MVKEIVVVEGKDDTDKVKRAVECETIETHGFGISRETWQMLDRAYEKKGLIILTDPDHAGNEIRKRLKEKYKDAKEAFLPRDKALKGDDIGVENAEPSDIAKAIEDAKAETEETKGEAVTMSDLIETGLTSGKGSRKLREELAEELGIGYGNAKAMVGRINAFGIDRDEFYGALRAVRDKRDKE